MNQKPHEGFTESEYQEWRKTRPIDTGALDALLDEYNKFMAPPEVMARPEEGI